MTYFQLKQGTKLIKTIGFNLTFFERERENFLSLKLLLFIIQNDFVLRVM